MPTTAILADDSASDAALLTLGISLYAAVILVCIGVGISAARSRRRRLAIIMAWVVGALTLGGLAIAIYSSVTGG
ncbi:hypothetical protein QSJ18_17010 [Gordonia sp. ABSL1-1]|uniref:hypothetical protein n=1 Tax=Gordonia sp. ABSL1-1 TaxID=3053923 RepID=UPI0025737743|nr:hypothetical protein [Gordonia sp. ABSL1-1]MDL9938451.1 hypothetical protein [Gordonia sp. ABSL1-1]